MTHLRVISGASALVVSAVAGSAGSQSPKPVAVSVEQQIAFAVSPAPVSLRPEATVLAYDSAGTVVTLRKGTNDMICIADDQRQSDFHVACYFKELDPFMARGRALRAKHLNHDQIDSVRAADIKAGRFSMPKHPTALYQFYAERDSVDYTNGTVHGAEYLYVVYTPYATPATTGILAQPLDGGPWLMYPGTPFAHIMISPQKRSTVTVVATK